MDRIVYLSSLFDIYGNLLTEKEQLYFKDYYEENLSLAEIAENYQISRNAVFKSLKKVEEKLEEYEKKLGLYQLKLKLKILKDSNNIKNIKAGLEELI